MASVRIRLSVNRWYLRLPDSGQWLAWIAFWITCLPGLRGQEKHSTLYEIPNALSLYGDSSCGSIGHICGRGA